MYWATTLVVSWEVCLYCALLVSVICVQKILCSCSSLLIMGFYAFFLTSKQPKYSFSQAMWSSWIRRNQHCVQNFPLLQWIFNLSLSKLLILWCLYFTSVHLPVLFSIIFIFRNMEWIVQSSVFIIFLLDFSMFWISWLKLVNSVISWNVHIVTRFLHLFISVPISSKVKRNTQSLKCNIVLLNVYKVFFVCIFWLHRIINGYCERLHMKCVKYRWLWFQFGKEFVKKLINTPLRVTLIWFISFLSLF